VFTIRLLLTIEYQAGEAAKKGPKMSGIAVTSAYAGELCVFVESEGWFFSWTLFLSPGNVLKRGFLRKKARNFAQGICLHRPAWDCKRFLRRG
jgi:hypothetical protein